MDPDLTLGKAKKTIRQRETVHEQQQSLKEENFDAICQPRPPSDASRQRSRTNGGSRRDNKLSSHNSQPNPRHHIPMYLVGSNGWKIAQNGREQNYNLQLHIFGSLKFIFWI